MKIFIPGLTLLLIALKLCGVITFGWVWVLSPLWLWFGLVALLLVFAMMCIIVRKN